MDALQHPWLKKMVNVEKVKTEVAKRTLSNLRNFRVSTPPRILINLGFVMRPNFLLTVAVKRDYS